MPDTGMNTPCYLFDASRFKKRITDIKEGLHDIPLTFSIKANPFLLSALPDKNLIEHVEVCSPGELAICRSLGVPGDRILYSGVMKEEWDIREALEYGVDIITSESRLHYDLICRVSRETGKKPKVLLRLSSGNQFGMSEEDILDILKGRDDDPAEITGLHFYSGTAKTKVKQIEKDLSKIRDLLKKAEDETGFTPELVEYGPGLSAEYYEEPYDEKDRELLYSIKDLLLDFSGEHNLGIEMGRFMAAPAGTYYTKVCDIKTNGGVNYAIVDGGIHQLKYYGQNMAMKIPPVKVERDGESLEKTEGTKDKYCICGSLCTVADVLIREIELPELKVGDILSFDRCGAYSVSEGALTFLSRSMPEIWIRDGETRCLREKMESWKLNCDY
ncbi:MAG: diaminopimelate decarboxylase [Lachnospiraceae bacterium]|nr:diaminopimelate decarboxylase [Lachnospiraceae bacterium]